MDFHVLSRKELQALCKKNMIPANMANVAMANALAALDKVEGLDEFINPPNSDPQQSPERTTQISTEPETSQPLTRTRRTTRSTVAGEAHHVNKDVILPETPTIPSSRRRAPSASVQRKQSIQEANSTRRSVRLLEKSMSKLCLMEKGRVEPVKVDGFSEEVEDVCDKNNASGAPIDALSPKIDETLSNEDSLTGEDSSVDNTMETEKPSMHNVLDTAKLSHSALGEGSDSNQSLLEDFSDQKLEAKDESGEYNAIQSAATAPNATLSPEIKKSLNSEEDPYDGEECGESCVVIVETEQPSIVNVTDSVIHSVLEEEGYSNVAPPEISSDEKSKAVDQSKNYTEISEDSNATDDQAVVILELPEEERSVSNPILAEAFSDKEPEIMYESECTEILDHSNATNDQVAAGGNIEAPFNYFSIESKMESFVGGDAIEVKELNMASWDSDKTSETVVDVKEITIEELERVERETTTPLRQASPCQQPLAARVSSSPFAEGTLQGQFPRLSQPIAKITTSAEKPTTILSGINKENIDYSIEEAEWKKDEADKKDIKEKQSAYGGMSLRTLRKMFKEQLIVNKSENHVEKNTTTTKDGKRRNALQMRPENCMLDEAEPTSLSNIA